MPKTIAKPSVAIPAKQRMAAHRKKRKRSGEKLITVHLSADASVLLDQMMKFSASKTRGQLLSDAINELAFSYEYWGIAGPTFAADLEQLKWVTSTDPMLFLSPTARTPPWIADKQRELRLRMQREDPLNVYR